MGLPDFHRIQQGFSAYKFFNNRYAKSGVASHDFINESFRGEIISAFFAIECKDKRLNNADSIEINLDGNSILNRTFKEILTQTAFSGENVIMPIRYDYQLRLHFYIRAGLGFITNIQVIYTSTTTGDYYIERNGLFGVY